MSYGLRATARHVALVGILIFSPASFSLSFKKVWALQLDFSSSTSALLASEKTKLIEFIEKIQRDPSCVEFAISEGYADISEGKKDQARKLSEERAQYVADLLQRYGVPARLIHKKVSHTLPGCAGSRNACAVIEVQSSRRGAPTCP